MAKEMQARVHGTLKTALSRTDDTLTHLSRVLSSSAGVDATLCTICYSLTFLHSHLRRTLERRYERLALTLASKASQAMFPGETVVTTIEPPRTWLSETRASVKAAVDLIDSFRIFVRLWGLLSVYNSARDNYLKPPGDAILKTVLWAEVAAGAIFQVLENGAYLASKGILRGERWAKREPKWWVWSNRFWMTQVVLEMLRLLRVRQLQYNEDFGAKDEKSAGPDLYAADKVLKVESAELKKKWHRDFYANAGWFPLTLHWSFEDESRSPISEAWIGLCGIVPGVIAFRECWAETAT